MNRVKLLSAAAVLLTAFAGPVMAEGGHGHGGGGMAMSGGAGQSVGGAPHLLAKRLSRLLPERSEAGEGSSANTATGSMVRGDSGRNFASGGGERGERQNTVDTTADSPSVQGSVTPTVMITVTPTTTAIAIWSAVE